MAMEDSWAKSIKIINAPPFHLAILFLGISPTNMLTLEQKHTCVRVLIAALLRKGEWTQSECPLFSPWMNELSCMCAQSLQSCPTLCNPMDHSPPGSSVHEILKARILEWIAMPFSRGSSQPRDRTRTCLYCRWIIYPLSHLGSRELSHIHPLWENHICAKSSKAPLHTLRQELQDAPGRTTCLTEINALPVCGNQKYKADTQETDKNRASAGRSHQVAGDGRRHAPPGHFFFFFYFFLTMRHAGS